MSKHKEITIASDLMCLDCGDIFKIRRKRLQQRKEGHIKDLYCPICKAETRHYELKDKDIFLWKYSYVTEENVQKIKIDDETKQAIFLLRKREEANGRQTNPVLKKVPSPR